MKNDRRSVLVLLTLSIVLSGSVTPLFAEEDALDQAEETFNADKSNDKYKVVCTREAPVGSRIKKKVCRTIAQSENTQREIKRSFTRVRTSVSQNPGGG